MPSILKDGALFFPNVLTNQVFQKSGILWGQEAYGIIGLHWVVIDPRRHKMYVWEKHQSDFVQAAYSLGASVFTNGSFNDYVGGNKYVSTAKVFITTFVDALKVYFSHFHTPSQYELAGFEIRALCSKAGLHNSGQATTRMGIFLV